ncbi:uncharacterized protein LOC117233577 [Bombus vosnesenskii]|uniref:Uncharacterized protein LOC117233577 n=1 Tax=Bombus vosnesenskii TaxID=207650 RepID=A0A6J3KBS9_9HYME|nr:uncharacterized protein LOC117233577 [Bombus vosnesenskii]
MLDNDVDSWYDCKRDDINEMHSVNDAEARNGVCLISSSRWKNVASDDSRRRTGTSRSNGTIRCGTIPTSSRSGTEVRFINPAIYAETLNGEDVEHEVEIEAKVGSRDDERFARNCGDSAGISDMMSTLSINNDLAASFMDHAGDQGSAEETYRCYSLNSPTTCASLRSGIVRSKSVTSCKHSNRIERRCKIADRADNSYDLCSTRDIEWKMQSRYTFNGQRVVQVSTSSISDVRITGNGRNESDVGKKITYGEWMRKKQEMARRKKGEKDEAERQRQMEEDRLAREKEERECRDRENFVKWSEMKKKEEEKKKAVVEKELEFQKQLKDLEDKAAVAKTLYLRQWARKKKEEERGKESIGVFLRLVDDLCIYDVCVACQKKEEMKRKKHEEERKKRLEESTKAYENWRKMAKNKPKPATQGLLPHQKAKPAYVNPTPWQRIVDDGEDVEQDASNVGGKTQGQPRMSSKRSAVSRQ